MGLGLYDNESRKYLEEPCKQHGHWYVADDGQLYIVPDDQYGIAEIDGPDDAVLDALNATYREADANKTDFNSIDTAAIAQRLGLSVIYDWQKRFDEESGYYHV